MTYRSFFKNKKSHAAKLYSIRYKNVKKQEKMSRFEDLLKKCKRRNSKAMMELYNICATPVYNASLHIVTNEFDAEEIMQDAILKAFDNIDRFLGTEKDFISFVKKIAINKSIDLFRKNSKTPFFTDVDNISDDIIDDDDEQIFSVDLIKKKIDSLSDGYRMVLNLHLLDELDFDVIAELMNIKPASVRSQYVRAKEKLKKELKIMEIDS